MAIDRKRSIIEVATKSFQRSAIKQQRWISSEVSECRERNDLYFFKNKEELFGEIISNLITEMKQVAESAIRSDVSFFENVHRALYSILEFRKEHQLMIKLIQEERDMGTKEVQEVMQQVDVEIVSVIQSYLKIAIEKGEISKCDPEITAFIMLRLYVSLIFDWEKITNR